MIRKQTKLWTTKDGRKIRICDMEDSHLQNSINLLSRYARHKESEAINAGFQMLSMLQGEMAIDSVERELDYIMETGIDPSEVYHLYNNLITEQERRKRMDNETKEWEFYIAGVRHHNIYKCIDDMGLGQFLNLVLEPTNKFDSNAVRIVKATDDEEVMIGYVPSKISAQVTAAITSEGHKVICEIIELEKDEKPWKQCKVSIRRENKDE